MHIFTEIYHGSGGRGGRFWNDVPLKNTAATEDFVFKGTFVYS